MKIGFAFTLTPILLLPFAHLMLLFLEGSWQGFESVERFFVTQLFILTWMYTALLLIGIPSYRYLKRVKKLSLASASLVGTVTPLIYLSIFWVPGLIGVPDNLVFPLKFMACLAALGFIGGQLFWYLGAENVVGNDT